MHLSIIPSSHVDKAWADGAACLAKACDASGGEITGDQLKMILARGERMLVALVENDEPIGWAVARIDPLPNMRVFMVTDLVARNVHFERFLQMAKDMGISLGCSKMRCAAKEAQARIYKHRCGFKPVYEILEVTL